MALAVHGPTGLVGARGHLRCGPWRLGVGGVGVSLAGYLVATMLLGACFGRTGANLVQLVGIEPHFHPGTLDLWQMQ